MKKEKDGYVPLSKEWIDGLQVFPKEVIIDFYLSAYKEKIELEKSI
jgi:hypothetical protein